MYGNGSDVKTYEFRSVASFTNILVLYYIQNKTDYKNNNK